MENKHIIVDLGSSRISLMATEITTDGAVRILSEESKKTSDVRYGVVEQASNAAYSINELSRLLKNSARLTDINTVGISINAKTMKQIPVQISRAIGFGRVVTESMLQEMKDECESKVRKQEVDVFEIIPLEYELDGKVVDEPANMRGSELVITFNVIIGSIFIKQELRRCFDRTTSIKLEGYTPIAMEALSIVLLDDSDRENGCALINFGATTTTLAIYAGGVLQELLVVPLGGKNITKDIQELGISEENAERLKCLKGSALESFITDPVKIKIPLAESPGETITVESNFLSTIIEARLTELMMPVFAALRDTEFILNAGIVITGGASKLNNMIEFLQEKTEMEVRYGNHADWLSDDTDERFFDPQYSQSIGTALLINEYLIENPEPVKNTGKGKNKNEEIDTKKKFTEKMADKFLRLFDD